MRICEYAGRAARGAAALLLIPAALAAQGITPEQVVQLQAVSDVALSPDGRHVAYTVTAPRDSLEEPGRAYSELYVAEALGDHPSAIVTRPHTAASPEWSPDGRWLGFLAALEGDRQRQLYVVPVTGGPPRRLTSSPASVQAFAWAPDGASLAYTAPEASSPRGPGFDQVVQSEQGARDRLLVQPLEGEARVISPEDRNVVAFAWAPDGGSLAVQATRETGADAELMFRDLFVLPAAGGTLRELAPTPGKLGEMAWSPDGRMLAYLGATSPNDPLAQSVFVVPAGGGEPRLLTPDYEGSAVWVDWLDARTVAFVADEGTKTTLSRVPAGGGRIERVAGGGAEIFGAPSFAADRRRFALPASTAAHPAEIYTGDVRSGELRRLTHHNAWLADVALGRQETIEWTGPEGLRIEGVVIYPVGFAAGRRYPLAILPHGGPEGVSQDGWNTRALYPGQVLAGRGYVVLMPNYRGSGGRGVAFSKADHRDLGGREFDDVLAGIDAVAERGAVDPNLVGISGTSYGGYFSAWAATRHSDRFKVAIPFAGLTNWQSFMFTTDIPVEMSVVHFDLWCTENVGLCWDRSPVAHVDGARTPTLIGHGLADDRVHPEQSVELYNALRLEGVPVELVTYPREPHGLNERAHQLDYMRRILEWFDRYLKPAS